MRSIIVAELLGDVPDFSFLLIDEIKISNIHTSMYTSRYNDSPKFNNEVEILNIGLLTSPVITVLRLVVAHDSYPTLSSNAIRSNLGHYTCRWCAFQ